MPARKTNRQLTEKDQRLIHQLAESLEKGHFNDYFEILQNTRRLLWKSFLQGLAKAVGAVIGATLVIALLVAILAMLGQYLPGEIGSFFTDIGKTIQQKP